MGSLILKQVTVGDTPSNGAISLYTKSDNALYAKDANGNESTFLISDANRNRIINGDMRIAQRNPTASGVSAVDGGYLTDRWQINFGGSYGVTPTWTLDTDVPTNAQAGRTFTNSLKILTTQDTTLSTDGQLYFRQKIEGYNISDVIGSNYNNGFTLSFWIKNSNPGIYCITFRNAAQDRSYVAEYTINAASTWEKKTITVTAAPSGTWQSTNLTGLDVTWSLAMGTTYNTATANAWASTNNFATPNQVNFASVASNVWITGVQLEAGTRATNFEYRNFQTELALCQRYYTKSYDYATALNTNTQTGRVAALSGNPNTAEVFTIFPVKMRGAPTIQIISQTGTNSKITVWASGADIGTTVTAAIATKGESKIEYITDAGNGLTTANLYTFHYTASAEL